MALNDDDKKYVKKTVDDSLDNKFKEMEKSAFKNATNPNEHKNKYVEKLKKEDQEKEDLHELLLELRERDKKGQNTIAQKVEMLNLTMKEAIPEDFRDAVKETGANIKKGATQSLRGLESLTGRVMNTNPLTAFLWANRGIVGDVWNIGAGAVNAGLGAVKGVARGAAGLVNASVNMFKKKKNKKQEKEEESTTSEIILNEETSNELEKEEDYDQSTAKKIDELHALFFKGDLFGKKDKEEKEKQNILQKGLSGLGKGMKAVNAIIETIAAKQKQILSGLMLGAVGILALIGWFKGGGLEKVLRGLLSTEDEKGDNVFIPNQVSSDNLDAALSGDEWKNAVTNKVNNKEFGKITEVAHGEMTLGTWNANDKLSKKGKASFKFMTDEAEKEMVIRAPFDCYLNKVEAHTRKDANGKLTYNDKESVYYRLYIEKVHTKRQGQGEVSWSEYEYCIYPVFDPKFTESPKNDKKGRKVIPKGTILGYAHGSYYIVPKTKGAYQHFDASFSQYVIGENKEYDNDYKESIENTGDFRTEEDAQNAKKNTVDVAQSLKYNQAMGKAKSFGEKVRVSVGTIANEAIQWAGGDTYNDTVYSKAAPNKANSSGTTSQQEIPSTVTEEPQKIPSPPKQVDQGSNAEDKMKQQDNTRKEVEAKKAEDDKQNQQIQQPQGKNNTNISIAPTAQDHDQPSEFTNIAQHNAMFNGNYLQPR